MAGDVKWSWVQAGAKERRAHLATVSESTCAEAYQRPCLLAKTYRLNSPEAREGSASLTILTSSPTCDKLCIELGFSRQSREMIQGMPSYGEGTYAHVLRSDQDELRLIGRSSGFDHHLHGDATVDGILQRYKGTSIESGSCRRTSDRAACAP